MLNTRSLRTEGTYLSGMCWLECGLCTVSLQSSSRHCRPVLSTGTWRRQSLPNAEQNHTSSPL